MNKIYLGQPSPAMKAWCKEKYGPKSSPNTKIYLNNSSTPTVEALIEGELNFDKIQEACPSCYTDNLTKIEIGSAITSLGAAAFAGYCPNLTSLTMTDSVTVIDQGAFYGCERLPSVTIPSSVTSIGRGAFNECYGLTSLIVNGKTTSQVQDMDNYPWGVEDESIIRGSLG